MISRRRAAFGLLLASAPALSACTYVPELKIVNNTGAPIRVTGWTTRTIAQGESGTLAGLRSRVQQDVPYSARVRAGGCDLRYRADIPSGYHAWQGPSQLLTRDFWVQMEPDFSLHLVPEGGARVVDVTAYARRQTDPFPLRPVEANCGA